MLVAGAGVGLCSNRQSDAQRITRFEEFQWQLGVQNDRIEMVAGGNIPTALEQVVLGIHGLDCSLGVVPNDVFKHHNIAGLADGIIWLRRNNQRECLQVRGDIELTAVVVAY